MRHRRSIEEQKKSRPRKRPAIYVPGTFADATDTLNPKQSESTEKQEPRQQKTKKFLTFWKGWFA
jgi:hypothetical protein